MSRDFLLKIASNPLIIFGGIAFISLFSLGAAFTAQYGFDLQPCSLCLIQRYPYALTTLLGLIGLALYLRTKNETVTRLITALCGLIFFGGGIIAFYHVGVEQHWWVSVLEGCAAGEPTIGSPADILAQIEKRAAVPCDQIPWQMFGVSMAGYNTVYSTGLALLCGFSLHLTKRC